MKLVSLFSKTLGYIQGGTQNKIYNPNYIQEKTKKTKNVYLPITQVRKKK